MSCYILEAQEVLSLVNFAHAYGLKISHSGQQFDCRDLATCQTLATAMRAENVLSFLYRYSGRHQEDIPQEPILFVPGQAAAPDIQEILDTAGSYDYNACEHPEYTESLAKSVVDHIKAACAMLMPGQQAIAKAEQQAIRDEERARLLQQYAHLEQPGDHNGVVLAARNIRTELKRAYPGVKFSVRSSSYSGGNSLTVRWQDGPESREVDALIGKYEHGHFDGMTDGYQFANSQFTELFGGTYYAHTSREISHPSQEPAEEPAEEPAAPQPAPQTAPAEAPQAAQPEPMEAAPLTISQALRDAAKAGFLTPEREDLDGARGEGYRVTAYRYARGRYAVACPSPDGFKTRAARLAEALGGEWVNRAKAYILGPVRAAQLVALFGAGYDASSFDGTLKAPPAQDRPTLPAPAPEGLEVVEIPAMELETLTGARVWVSLDALVAAARMAQSLGA